MSQYAARRLVRGILILFAVSVCSFLLSEAAPGDFFTDSRLSPQVSQSAVSAMRTQHGLDHPMAAGEYGHWVVSVIRGDWGYSLSYGTPVGALVWPRLRNALLLTITATILCWSIAIPAGVWMAATGKARNRLLGQAGLALLLATPELLVVLVLQFIAARWGAFPTGGMISPGALVGLGSRAEDIARHLALPVTALVLSALPVLIMHSASALKEALESPFIRGARANGIPRARLLYRHALPSAANPLISLLGLSVGALLSGSVLVESAMGWPGLGRLLVDATMQRDVHVVIAIVTLSAVFLVAGNFLADVLLYAADPRIRQE